MEEGIKLAKESGVGIVGVKNIGHSGNLSIFVEKGAKADIIAISMCQSDPRVVPYGGSENYFGTNPIAFGVPRSGEIPLVFDMASTVQAWEKYWTPVQKIKTFL